MNGGLSLPAAWLRLQAQLMPDYNRRAAAYWWLTVLLGLGLLLADAWALRHLDALAWLQVAAGAGFATLMGLFPLRVPGTKNSFVAGEIFLFLLLLLLGPAAAALAAAVEAAVGAWRTSKRWTSRIISPAVAALSLSLTGALLQQALQAWPEAGATGLVLLMVLFALACCAVTTTLISGVPRLKRGEAFFQWAGLVSAFRWVGLAYAGSAVMAALLFLTYRQSGAGVLAAVLPVLVLLLIALHYYFLQQEAAEAGRAVAERAAQEAAQHLQALQASERRFHSAFQHAAIGMALLAFDGRLLLANPVLRLLLGHGADEPLPGRVQALLHEDDIAPLNQRLGLEEGRESRGFTPFQIELRCRHRQGHAVWVLAHCGFFTEPESDLPCLILQVQDISARRQAEAGLQRLAFHDSLTGLPNRRQFLESLGSAVQRAQDDAAARFAVMYLDFDRFKLVNDSLGHNAGDELLVQMAQRIRDRLRPTDVVARLGGDEFAVLLPQLHEQQDALHLAERLLEAMRRPFSVAGHALVASVSIGITFSSVGYATPEQVLRDADTAMYRAKSQGKARYALFDDSLHVAVSRRLRLEGDLRRALEEQRLTLVYQPLLDLQSGRVTGFEALLRWLHPQDGDIGPADFIPLAEECGLITPLSDFVLRSACLQLGLWQGLAPQFATLTMGVNVSGHDIAGAAFVDRVMQAVEAGGISPASLTLELTEEAVMLQIEHAASNLARLRALGVQLAVDDFGTGYSSLSRLAKLPIDSLKIDRSFVHQMAGGALDLAVVQAVLQLGGALHKTVVAEGIETEAQAQALLQLGCGQGQGFHLSVPLDALAATAWLQAGSTRH